MRVPGKLQTTINSMDLDSDGLSKNDSEYEEDEGIKFVVDVEGDEVDAMDVDDIETASSSVIDGDNGVIIDVEVTGVAALTCTHRSCILVISMGTSIGLVMLKVTEIRSPATAFFRFIAAADIFSVSG